MKSSSQSGFALPTVLIAGIVMMIVLMTALVAASGGRANFDSQYYTRIAREAAESGALYAQECMVSHDYAVPWSGDDLHTGQDCDASGAESYMIESDDYRVKYVVADMPNEPDQNLISVTGYVERTRRSSGAVWRAYEYKLNMRASSETSAQRVAFGYNWGSTPSNTWGAHFGVLTAAGSIMGVGNNTHGQLGNGTTTNVLTPERYQLPDGVVVSKVYTNFLSLGVSMYAITTDGLLYASGANTNGMLTGGTNPVTTPQLISFPESEGVGTTSQVVEVSNMENSTYVTLSNGNVYASGNCANGKLGTGSGCSTTNTMTRVDLPGGVQAASAVVADGQTAFVVTTTGRVYGWGYNANGMLGNSSPSVGGSTNTPKRIGNFGNGGSGENSAAVSVSTDGQTVYIVTEDGSLYALGSNSLRQIANNSTSRYTSPTQVTVTGCTGSPVIDARTDHNHVAVLTADGRVCTAGYNGVSSGGNDMRGLLGRGANPSTTGFGQVTLPAGLKATSIWVNSVHTGDNGRSNNTFIVTDDGSVYGLGANYYGQLGTGASGNNRAYTPAPATRMNVFGSESGRTPAMSVRSGYGTTIIFAQNGRIYAVGNNSTGQLGDGTTTLNTTPRATRFLNIGNPSYF